MFSDLTTDGTGDIAYDVRRSTQNVDDSFQPGDLAGRNKLQEFVRDGSPDNWLAYGEELHDSAELLWQHESEGLHINTILNARHKVTGSSKASQISRSYMLLAGFALENILKGLLVAADPAHINSGRLSGSLKSHDLEGLASKIQHLKLSRPEREFCSKASQAIPYWGRYPIPVDKGRVMPSVAVTARSRRVFLRLFERLSRRLYRSVRDGWDSGVGAQTLKMRSLRYDDQIDLRQKLFE